MWFSSAASPISPSSEDVSATRSRPISQQLVSEAQQLETAVARSTQWKSETGEPASDAIVVLLLGQSRQWRKRHSS